MRAAAAADAAQRKSAQSNSANIQPIAWRSSAGAAFPGTGSRKVGEIARLSRLHPQVLGL